MQTLIRLTPTLAVAWLAASTLDARADDWPHWRGPNYNGISQEKGWRSAWPAEGPKVLWKANVGVGFSSFSVSEGRVYTMGNGADQDSVYCFEAATGKVVWQHTYACKLEPKYYEGGTSATPTVHQGRVYTLSKFGHAHALDAVTGKVIWAKNLAEELSAKVPTWGFAGSVLVQDKRLYYNVGEQGTALDLDGKVVWTSGKGEAGYSTFVPVTVGGSAGLAAFGAKAVFAVDAQTGKEQWSYPWKTSYDVNAADPILSGDQVFISSGYNRGASVVRLAEGKGTKVWESKVMRNHFNSCVLLDGHLYGFDEDILKCVVFDTGAVKWEQKGLGKGALMVADGKLIVQAEKGELLVAPADPAGFKPSGRAQVLGGKCWTTPVLAQGRIYSRNAAGDVVCVDVAGR